MMPLNQPPTPSPMSPSGGGPTQGVQLHPAVAQAFRQRLMGGRPMGAPGGIVPPGPRRPTLDDSGGGGGPMGFPPGNTSGRGPGGGIGNPLGYNFEVYTPPAPSPVPNPWGQGNDPFNVNGPGGPHSYGNPEGPDGRGFGGGGPMGFPGGDNRGPGGGPMPFPPNGPMGNAPGGPWGGNPNSYGPAEGFQKPFGLPQENQMQPFGGPQGMRDRQGPWSRRLGEAPQGPQGWQW